MIRVVTDSVASVPEAYRDQFQQLTLFVNHKGKEYADATMDVDAFYGKIGEMVNDIPTSSQPSAGEFKKTFEDAAQAGDSVLGIFISTALSGTYDSALRSAREVAAEHADFRFALVDSASCGGEEGFAVADAIDAVKRGRSLSHCAQGTLLGVQSTRFLFSPNSLDFLKAGGRVGRASSLLGNLVHINPILTVRDGSVGVLGKVRTMRKACRKIVDLMEEDARSAGGIKRIIVHYIGDRSPAEEWAKSEVEPFIGHSVEVMPVSPVIGLHVGPALGVAYECNAPLKNKITGNVQDRLCLS